MRRRIGAILGVAALLLLAAALAFVLWRRFGAPHPTPPHPTVSPIPVSPAPTSAAPPRVSTIIDLPGDPALVRRPEQKAPRPISLAVPSSLGADAARIETEAFFITEPLAPAGGGYLGKFTDNGQEANSLNAELAMNTAPTEAGEGAGDDDDGGDLTPDVTQQPAPLTGANSQQLDVVEGAESGRAQLKQAVLRPKIAQKISELLVESGFDAASAADVEAAAKRLYKIQTLRVGSAGLAVGALTPSGDYRVTQLALFEDGEYVGTVALGESGLYGEGAEPNVPAGLLDDSDLAPVGTHFNLADGIYSAGLRSAAPEPVIREAVHLLSRVTDLEASLAAGETLRLIYAKSPRDKSQPASRVIYVGLTGATASADCYAFTLPDGGYGCFTEKAAEPAEPVPLPPSPGGSGAPMPPVRSGAGSGASSGHPADSGAAAVGGLLAPIRGAPVTSLFGMRFHPILHITRLHAGIDFGAAVGSQVRAAADGVVDSAGEARGYGSRVVVKHGGYETTYNHLSEIRVSVGAKVHQGEIIALSGNSGLSTGPHLHFEYRVNGDPQDPMPHMGREVQARAPAGGGGPVFAGASVPVPPENTRPAPPDPAVLAAFAAAKAEIDQALADAGR